MGAVYRARDRRLARFVALKFIRSDDPGLTRRFMQEARAQSRIDHPSVCKVYEVGEVDGRPYIAMQLIEGKSLDLLAPTLPIEQKARIIREIAAALHTAHELGVIHRDIKPSNIMVEQPLPGQLHPIIMDFGLAREAGEEKGLTESGAVMGTVKFFLNTAGEVWN
jgi:serine/threonine-protein kinase